MKQTGWKRLCAAMLTLAMLLSVVPSVGFAVDAPEQPTDAIEIPAEEERAAKTYSIQVSAEDGGANAGIEQSNGNVNFVKEAAPGETIHLKFSDFDMTPGTAFVKWVDDNGNLTDMQNVDSYYNCTFTMPEGEVRIHAELAKTAPQSRWTTVV